VRKEALSAIESLLDQNESIVFIGSDLGTGTLAQAKIRHPKRVFMEGISEQHIVGFAAGLALEGFIPYVHTIGTFLTRRALEQIIVDVSLQNLNVNLIASGGGMVYAPLGPTHQSVDDFALMRAIPNMTIVAPADPIEMKAVINQISKSPGPTYVRVAKGGEKNITSELSALTFGKIRKVVHGANLAVITTGVLLHECLSAFENNRINNFQPSVYHVPYISPLDEETLIKISKEHSKLVVIEEHLPNGGLFSSVAEVLVRNNLYPNTYQISLKNKYSENYGNQLEHWRQSGLDSRGIYKFILDLI
jgi:transketolase